MIIFFHRVCRVCGVVCFVAWCGVVCRGVSCLQDLVRTRLAAQTASAKYKGLVDATRTIVKEEGVAGLYKGLWTSCLVSPPIPIILYLSFIIYYLISITF
jgi:hypothetical protein